MRFIFPFLIIGFISLFPQSAIARCYGSNLYDSTSAEFQATIKKRVDRIPFAQGRYFTATKNGKTSWIIGTIHASDARVSRIPRFFREKIKNSRLVLIETTKLQDAQYLKLLSDASEEYEITAETDASSHFTPQEWSIIQKEARKHGLSNYLHRYLPLNLIAQIVTTPKCDPQNDRFLDANIEKLAKRSKKNVGGLDNVKLLVKQDLKNPWPDKTMVQFIKLEIPRMHLRAHHVETTIQMYLSDRVTTYLEFSNALTRSYLPKNLAHQMNAEYHNAIIVDRNVYWMKRLGPELAKGNVVVAIGAAHLSGNKGVLNLLKKRGFKIQAISM